MITVTDNSGGSSAGNREIHAAKAGAVAAASGMTLCENEESADKRYGKYS